MKEKKKKRKKKEEKKREKKKKKKRPKPQSPNTIKQPDKSTKEEKTIEKRTSNYKKNEKLLISKIFDDDLDHPQCLLSDCCEENEETIKKDFYENKKKEKISLVEKTKNLNSYNAPIIDKKIKEKIIEKEKEEKEKLEKELKKYKLNYNSEINKRRMNKSFDIKIKPKGYNEYIIRNRKEILNKEKLKEKKGKLVLKFMKLFHF